MERQSHRLENLSSFSKLALSLLSAYLVWEVAFGAANGDARNKVKERAGGECEECGISGVKLIVGHLDHTENRKGDSHYHDTENLKMHCWSCETIHHLDHIGLAAEIGMSEQNNKSAIMSSLTLLAKESPERLEELYWRKRRKGKIDAFFQSFGTSYQEFFRKNTAKKPTKKPKKFKLFRRNPKPSRGNF